MQLMHVDVLRQAEPVLSPKRVYSTAVIMCLVLVRHSSRHSLLQFHSTFQALSCITNFDS